VQFCNLKYADVRMPPGGASMDANADWVRWNGHLDLLVEVEVMDHVLKLEQAPSSNDLGKTGRRDGGFWLRQHACMMRDVSADGCLFNAQCGMQASSWPSFWLR